MGQMLSQNEIDALLDAVMLPEESNNISSSSEKNHSAVNVTPYDLGNQDRVIRGRMITFDVIYERFIRLFRINLSSSLRKIASLSILSTDLMKFGEFLNTLPIPSCIGVMRFESLRGSGLIVLETKLVYALINSYFGGSDHSSKKGDGKEYTRIELSILEKVIKTAISDLNEAWEPVHKTDISFTRLEVNPQFVSLIPPSDVVVSTAFEVELENTSGTISIVIPYSTLDPIKKKLHAGFQPDGEKFEKVWAEQVGNHLDDTKLNSKVCLGEADLTIFDLISLNLGDTVLLDRNADEELDLKVENIPKFKCILGNSKGNKAIQITRKINNRR